MRYENAARILVRTGKCVEGERRLSLKKELGKSFKDFQQAVQSYYNNEMLGGEEFKDFWSNDFEANRYLILPV